MSKFSDYLKENELTQFLKNWLSLNRWVIFLYIFISAGSTIFYVRNVMIINNHLLLDVQNYSKTNNEMLDHIKILEMEKNRLESAERIIPIAEKNLGLVPMIEPPTYIK